MILLWLANRATDAGVCFPTKRELSARTGLSERMVRYHLESLAQDHDEHGTPREPIVSIIERRVAGDRNTSNVYALRVPWASAEVVRSELDELKHIPAGALWGVGTTGCTQGGDDALHPGGYHRLHGEPVTTRRSPGYSPLPPTAAAAGGCRKRADDGSRAEQPVWPC